LFVGFSRALVASSMVVFLKAEKVAHVYPNRKTISLFQVSFRQRAHLLRVRHLYMTTTTMIGPSSQGGGSA
jgi:hypothetical protein